MNKLPKSISKKSFLLPETITVYDKFIWLYLPWGIFVWSCPKCGEGGGSHSVPPNVNFDRRMLLTWNLAQSYFGMLQKNGRKTFSKLQL